MSRLWTRGELNSEDKDVKTRPAPSRAHSLNSIAKQC